MAYKCNNCGHIFEKGEAATWTEAHGFTDGFCETFYGCPMCRGDYEETAPCKNCEREKTEDELYNGLCKECLEKRLTKETAIKYLVESGIVVDFAFTVLFGIEVPQSTSKALLDFILPFVECHANEDNLSAYIFDDEAGIEDFAEWLSMANHIEKEMK